MKFPMLKIVLASLLCLYFPSQASAADKQIITITKFPNGNISHTVKDNQNNIISGSFGAWPPKCMEKKIYRAYTLMSKENLNTIEIKSKNGDVVTYSLEYESEAPLFSKDSCE